MEAKVLLETKIPDKRLYARGKVRDNYDIPGWWRTNREDLLLMIATDRISAFDVVLPNGILDKGKILTQISLFWFERTKKLCPNHVFSDDQQFCAATVKEKYRQENDLLGRCTLARKAKKIPVECVVRGYLDGSAWEAYQREEPICGIKLQPGLKRAEELPQPIFTPTTKAESGHDQPLTFDELVKMVGGEVAEELRDKSLLVYHAAHQRGKICGIIIADTKFEFGIIDGEIILIDELLTPDSSRFWDFPSYRPGGPQPSFDKQPVRDWLTATGWNKKPPAPPLPEEVIAGTSERYGEAYERLVGKTWPPKFV